MEYYIGIWEILADILPNTSEKHKYLKLKHKSKVLLATKLPDWEVSIIKRFLILMEEINGETNIQDNYSMFILTTINPIYI